ncbi:MAG: histidine phosphatase family protein [Alphaproteobacteria bacterium]|nr:MAG: histidine phosphatase family protein [Alphaproteobacteria bacterium]
MRRLILLRHAKSDWSAPGARDLERPLSARGRAAAPRMGAYMARHALVPDLIVASPAVRVAETLEHVLPAFKEPPQIRQEERVYESGADTLLAVIKATPKAVHSLLLVGHNPGMAELASLLIAAGDVEARQQLIEKFPTGALAVIDFPLDDWGKLHPKAGRLDRFVVPKALDSETA